MHLVNSPKYSTLSQTTPTQLLWVNLLTAKLFNFNFYPLEGVSRWRDPQLQVSENI